jgi:serine/threonine protein kinase
MGCCESCLGTSSPPQYQTVPNTENGSGGRVVVQDPAQIDLVKQTTNALLESNSSGSYQQGGRYPAASTPIEIYPSNGTSSVLGSSRRTSGSKAGFFVEYDLKEEIGVGSTAKCFRCVRKSDSREFACKVVDKRSTESNASVVVDQFVTEIKVLKTLDHPNIVKLVDTFETADRIYVIMELMKGGELFDYVVEKGTLSEQEASVIIRKITSAVAHMHAQNIIHRDLKPENLVGTR